MSPGKEIPGYSGYVPKKGPGNVYGKNFRRSNEAALDAEARAANGSPGAGTEDPWDARRPRYREHMGEIPSHIDHVPRKTLYSVASERTLVQGDTASVNYPKGRQATGEIGSHINHVPRKCRSLRNLRDFAADDCAPAQPPPLKEADSMSEGRRSMSPGRTAIPGYAGYVPKVAARNVYGMRYRAATENAARLDEAADDRQSVRSGSTCEVPERHVGIPGYAGYIPKKGPANVLGATFRAANERAARGADPVNEAVTETARLQEGSSVWEPWNTTDSVVPKRKLSETGARTDNSNPRPAAGMIVEEDIDGAARGNDGQEGWQEGDELALLQPLPAERRRSPRPSGERPSARAAWR